MAVKRNILITGAGSGIGQGLALAMQAAGNEVHLVDLTLGHLGDTVARMQSNSAPLPQLYACDLASEQSLITLIEAIREKRIDVLINNAGLQRVAKIEDFAMDDWHRLMAVMVTAPFMLLQGLLPGMRQRGYGRCINIGSIHSIVASPFKPAYVAAKHALVGLSKVAALETADAEITVNTICPSYVHTALVEKQIQEQASRHHLPPDQVVNQIMLEPMPKKRFIEIDEIVGAVEFLISHSARNITGQSLVIDGGWTVR